MCAYDTVKFQMFTNLRAQPSVFSNTHMVTPSLPFFSPGEFSCTAAKQNSIE